MATHRRRDILKRDDRGDVPQMGAGQVDAGVPRRIAKLEAVGEDLGAGEKDLPGDCVEARNVLRIVRSLTRCAKASKYQSPSSSNRFPPLRLSAQRKPTSARQRSAFRMIACLPCTSIRPSRRSALKVRLT